MAERSYRFNTKSLCDLFNIDGATILEETYESDVLNGKVNHHKGWKNAS